MDYKRYGLLVLVLVAIGGTIVLLDPPELGIAGRAEITTDSMEERVQQKAQQYPRAREIINPAGFINTDGEPIRIGDYIGEKVILVDFWTYSCINCQRTTPYLNAWHKTYEDDGLLIIGVHTPEFEFEKEYANVQAAVEQFGIAYPVVLDNDYGTWSAYQNRYWPRKYLIDIDGFVVYDHIGEGAYAETEKKIRELLEERVAVLDTGTSVGEMANPEGVEEVDTTRRRTPEMYFGAWRNSYLGNGETNVRGEQQLSTPTGIKTHILYLDGTWNIAQEYAANTTADATITLRYQAQKVFMVARAADDSVRARIFLDGEPISDDVAGSDVDANGYVTFDTERLYRLIEAPVYGEHTLEIRIEEEGLDAFTFTFG